MAREPNQLPRDFLGGEHKVDASPPNRILRHVKVFRGLLILRKSNPACNLDGNTPCVPSEAVPDKMIPTA